MATSPVRQTFPKQQRLRRRRWIKHLFKTGKRLRSGALLLRYCQVQDGELPTHQVLFIVGKRQLRSAVARNLVRRRLREAYRKHQHLLGVASPMQPRLLLAYRYLGQGKASYTVLEAALRKSLQQLKSPSKVAKALPASA